MRLVLVADPQEGRGQPRLVLVLVLVLWEGAPGPFLGEVSARTLPLALPSRGREDRSPRDEPARGLVSEPEQVDTLTR